MEQGNINIKLNIEINQGISGYRISPDRHVINTAPDPAQYHYCSTWNEVIDKLDKIYRDHNDDNDER